MFYLEKNPTCLTVLLGKLFVFAFTWSFGGNFKRQDDYDSIASAINHDSVDIASEFDSFVNDLFEVEPPLGVRLPTSGKSIYGYFVDLETGNFVSWENLIPSTQSLINQGTMMSLSDVGSLAGHPSRSPIDGILVPTIDTVRYSFLCALMLVNRNPVLLTGLSKIRFITI